MKRSQLSLGWKLGGLSLLLTLSTGGCSHKGPGQDSVASSPKPSVAHAADAAPGPVASAGTAEPAAMAEAAPSPDASAASSAAEPPTNAGLAPGAAPSSEASGSNVWAIPARDALLRASCARCHNGSLPTSVPAALAIYNLVEDPWYGRLKPGNYDGILRRVTGSTSIPEADKTAIVSFVHCARDADCGTATADPR